MPERIRVTVEGPEWLEYDPSTREVVIDTGGGRIVVSLAGSGLRLQAKDGQELALHPRDAKTLKVTLDGLPF